MAFGTLEIAAMIEGLVAQPGMPVISRSPGGRAMAKATVLRRIEVPRVHPGGRSAIVAGRAGTQDLRVINGSNGRPDICAMAIFADVGRLRVQWTLADRICSVVAADTVVDDVRVVEVGWQPRDSSVAVVTIVTAGDMCGMFADCYHTIMAGAAGADDLSVINRICRYPGVRCMAILTDDTGKNMVGVLARRIRTVVATRTISGDIDMVEIRR